MPVSRSLDRLALEAAQAACRGAEGSGVQTLAVAEQYATAGLQVLQEHGSYAVALFLQSRKRHQEVADALLAQLSQLGSLVTSESVFGASGDLLDRLARLESDHPWAESLVSDAWRMMLVYTRFVAKARRAS